MPDWTIETVDTSADIGRSTGIALDSSGNPHIVYGDDDAGSVKYATRSGGSWTIEVIEASIGRQRTPYGIAIDSNGVPHVCYGQAGDQDQVKYANRSGGSWSTEIVDATVGSYPYCDIAVDDSDVPYISYLNGANVKCAYKNGSWTIETAGSKGHAHIFKGRTRIAIDCDGYPHIAFVYVDPISPYDPSVKYTYRDIGGWSVDEGVGEAAAESWLGGMVLDGDDYPHISYSITGALKYAYKDAAGWTLEVADSSHNTYEDGIALDSDGYPHISYDVESPSYDLWYAHKDADGWNTEMVDDGDPTSTDVGEYTDIALDSNDSPHISYKDCDNDDLKYAYVAAAEVSNAVVYFFLA